MVSDERLADELRSLARVLHANQVDDESRRLEAYELLRRANRLLADGDKRLRWYEREADARGRQNRTRELSPFSGALNATAPPIRAERGDWNGKPCMWGRVHPTRVSEGPPGRVHGGIVAGLFDEMMGTAQALTGNPGAVTGRLTVRYRRATPIDTDLLFCCWVEQDRGMIVEMKAHCLLEETVGDERPVVTAEAEALFVRQR